MVNQANKLIEQLNLIPHPEGGHYSETYKSQIYLSTGELNNCVTNKNCSTLIYFLLKEHEYSAFHKLKSDEVWIYNSGDFVNIYIIDSNGKLSIEKFGSNIDNGENLQVFIPANSWFAAELINKDNYILMSCLVSPGFDWNDFELGKRETLKLKYPEHTNLFKRLCKE